MATLHMDVETVSSAQGTMVAEYDVINSSLGKLNAALDNLVAQGTWQGASATEFNGTWDDVKRNLTTAISGLESLSKRLKAEIAEWDTMQQHLSG